MFTHDAARLLGDHGRLVCVDLQMAMLRPLQRDLRAAGARTAFLQAATAERLALSDASFEIWPLRSRCCRWCATSSGR